MDEQNNAVETTQQSKKPSAVSVREQSTEALTRAIQAPGDEAWVMERADECLSLFYEPDMDGEKRFKIRASFGRALRFTPAWAVSQGFDRWEREEKRRPSPGEILALADKALARYRNELAEREKIARATAFEPDRQPISAEEAERITRQFGFTVKRTEAVQRRRMARSEAELYGDDTKSREPHWTESRAPDDPDMVHLRQVRDSNPLIQEARKAEAKRLERERQKEADQ